MNTLNEETLLIINRYIEENYIPFKHYVSRKRKYYSKYYGSFDNTKIVNCCAIDFENLKKNLMHHDKTFVETLFYLIDKKKLDEVTIYKNALVSKQTFSNIRSNINFVPKKHTIMSLCIAMNLNMDETIDLLLRAGYALSNSNKTDIIFKAFIASKTYDLSNLNMFLIDQGLKPITKY